MENIIDVVASEQHQEDYLRYAVYTLYSRVMPDYRDGLKPVQRRILWAMYNDAKAIDHTVKSTTVVGAVIGYWHPHGDASAYGAIRPMVNWFESKVPLVDKQGNFGDLSGHRESAARYTECKLSKFTIDCIIGDLQMTKEAVDWEPNFDNTRMEPAYLPCAVPLLLINGTFAIGVGKKPQIPSHNLNEVIDATLALIKNPNAEVVLVPDHCLPCEIVDTDFAAISRTGFGYYTVRGVIDIEKYENKTALVIKSLPNLIFLDSVVEKIEQMISNKKLVQIEKHFDQCTDTEMRYVIVLKNGADPNYVRDVIYKNTPMESRERINFEALNNLNPIRMNYRSYLLSFIDHRKLTKFRVFTNRLRVTQTRIYEREAYIKALESGYIDEIISMIRKMKGNDDDKLAEYLIKKLDITMSQALFIMNIPLKRTNVGSLPKFKKELKDLQERKKQYMEIIVSDEKLTQVIVDELLMIKKKYGQPRMCKIVKDTGTVEIPKGAMTVIFTENNFVKKVPFGQPIGSFRGDSPKISINVDNSDAILIFDNTGKVFRLNVNDIQFSDPVDIRYMIKSLTANITNIIPEFVFKNANKNCPSYLITLTKNGLIKKMDIADFVSIPSSGLIYVRLDQGDFVQSVEFGTDYHNAIVFSDKKALNYPVDMISQMKRNAKGNKTFSNGSVDGLTIIPAQNQVNNQDPSLSILVITENGRFNKLPVSSLPKLDSVKKQFQVIKLGRDKIVSIHLVNDNSTIMIKTLGNLLSIPVNTIKPSSTISTGEKLINTTKDKIVRTYLA